MTFLDDKSPHNTRSCWPQSCDGENAVSPFYLKFQYFGIFWILGKFVISLEISKHSKTSKPRDDMSDSHSISSRGLDLLDLLDFLREVQ